MCPEPVVVIGAGPAGVTAGYELLNAGIAPVVVEKAPVVGGISRTHVHKGYRFDLGGHRFYTKIEIIDQLWRKMLGEDLLTVDRLSRIFYRDKFIHYPLDVLNVLVNLGPVESLRILASYLRVRLRPLPVQDTFEQWVTNRFGRRLYEVFFQTYTEKVWGIPCNQIEAEWAAQRIQGLSLTGAIIDSLFGAMDKHKTLIRSFSYPRLGAGMMWERFAQDIEQRGGTVQMNTAATRINISNSRVVEVCTESSSGERTQVAPGHVISTAPIADLVMKMDPPAPDPVLKAALGLRYRAFLVVGLVVNRPHVFADNWIYVHNPNVKVGRVQNFKTWSRAMVPDENKTSLGMEYFCNEGDEMWTMSDEQLIQLASREIVEMGLAQNGDVEEGLVIRQSKAYPVYDRDYRRNLDVLREYVGTISNLQTIGRNGLHRYNNMDHSMFTAMLAVKNLLGQSHDVWEVNTEQSYGETFT